MQTGMAPTASSPTRWSRAIARHLCVPGIILGALFFALALTPSLLPRGPVVQGLLAGCVFAVGYALGATLEWFWRFFELRAPPKIERKLALTALFLSAAVVVIALFLSKGWQNSVRIAIGAAPADDGYPLTVLLVSLAPALLLVVVGTCITLGVQRVTKTLSRALPRRVAALGGLIVVGTLTALVFSGVLLRNALHAADKFYSEFDRLAGDYGEPPQRPLQSGSSASLVAWEGIGHDGRIYVSSGPTREQIEAVIGRPAIEPLRVYVGLRSAPTVQERAQLAFDEMLRVGAFDRSILVIATPVGQGWIDPAAIDTLEYLMAGDVASVGLQYSNLVSPLSLLAEPDYGSDSAAALFRLVYTHWSAMPHERRPRLYLHGVSLGAHASLASTGLLNVMADPFDGALWSGPPFTARPWRTATRNRQPGSPAWRPHVGNGSIVRFTNGGDGHGELDAPFGRVRFIFLQHANDPIVFFDPFAIYREPDWMKGERGPGVPASLRWYPVVTFFQLAMDMALSQTATAGQGHIYSTADYLYAWVALIDPPGWDAESLTALNHALPANPARIGMPRD